MSFKTTDKHITQHFSDFVPVFDSDFQRLVNWLYFHIIRRVQPIHTTIHTNIILLLTLVDVVLGFIGLSGRKTRCCSYN